MCIIRPAEAGDAESLIALMKSQEGEANLLNEIGEFSFTPEQEIEWIERFAQSPNSVFLIAQVDGQIVGTCGCQGGNRRVDHHVARLGIAVHRDFRGRGIGSKLMQAALDWAQSTLVRRVELSVFARNEGAIRLYQRFGFEIEGRHKNAVFKRGEFIDTLTMARWDDGTQDRLGWP